MKKLLITVCAFLLSVMSVHAQTVNVHIGNITVAFNATAGEMPFSDDGASLAIGGVTYKTAEIDSIIVDNSSVTDNTVNITYNGFDAKVLIAGNVAPYLVVAVSGAHVAVAQSVDLANEVTYTLSGSSADGSFYMSGKLKATLVFNELELTNPDSAAVNIQNGKRIAVVLADGTQNTLSDGESGSQKGSFMVKGHTEFQGGGTLTLAGNTKHAFWGGEYVELKKSLGAITISSAVGDGMNINQYFEQKGGALSISGTGDDGIQVSVTDDADDELNGQAIISGGTMNIAVSATAAKGLKCDSLLTIEGGEIVINTTGGGEYDSDDNDASACAAIKSNGDIVITDGTLTLKSTGAGGKGLSADGNLTISGGTITATTTGKQYTYGRTTASAKAIKSDGNLTIAGGTITATTTGGEGSEGIESKKAIVISDGEIVVQAYDDCINAANSLKISGGKIYALSTNNDGIDSNGVLYISGGLVIASGTQTPEEGFDCDENTFGITGGTIIGVGGSTSTPTTSATTQPVMILGGQQFSSGTYITLTLSGSSTPLFAFRIPQTYRQATLLLSHPDLSTGNAYVISSGATVSGGNEWHGYTDDATISGASTLATMTLSSMVTSQGSSSGGGGGGGGFGGGGGGRH